MRPASLASPELRADRAQPDAAPALWSRMAVTASPPGPTGPILVPAGLRRAMWVLDLAVGGPAAGVRSTPSAGAIYPFEYYLLVGAATGGTDAWRLDPATRRMILVRSGSEAVGELFPGGLPTDEREFAVAVVVSRPWLSMRKYGDRGYLYTQLDSAHAVAGIGLAARALGTDVYIRHVPDAGPLAEALAAALECRQIHSAVAFALPAERTGPVDQLSVASDWQSWQAWDGRRSEATVAQWMERQSWESLRLPQSISTQLTTELEFGSSAAQVFAKDIARRRSASGFEPGALSAEQIRMTLDYTAGALPAPSTGRSGLAVTALLRPELRAALAADAIHGVRLRDLELSRQEVGAAFLAQDHLREAACVILCHAEESGLVYDSGVLHEAIFRAGCLGQLVYLGATVAGVGVTGVGGFDSAQWCRTAGLPQGHEVVYVLALGRETGSGDKLDRAEPAYAQNQR